MIKNSYGGYPPSHSLCSAFNVHSHVCVVCVGLRRLWMKWSYRLPVWIVGYVCCSRSNASVKCWKIFQLYSRSFKGNHGDDVLWDEIEFNISSSCSSYVVLPLFLFLFFLSLSVSPSFIMCLFVYIDIKIFLTPIWAFKCWIKYNYISVVSLSSAVCFPASNALI